MKFKIEWCELCKANVVICPKCGNGSCSGGYGEVNGEQCDICPLTYQYNDLYTKIEDICTCQKDCICTYQKKGFFDERVLTNDLCPVHTKNVKPNPECPVHGNSVI